MVGQGLLLSLLTLLAPLCGGCSTVPAASYPPFAEHHVAASYQFAPGGEHRAAVPASDAGLLVQELSSEPPAVGEQWEAGQRYLLAPPGCRRFEVRCRYRVYGDPRTAPTPARLFPDADVRELP